MKRFGLKINCVLITLLLGWLAWGQAGGDPKPEEITNAMRLASQYKTEADVVKAYHAGKIDKGDAMLVMGMVEIKEAEQNGASMDTYGKVVDQNGQPVAGVKVKGRVHLGLGEGRDHYTETDAQGQFLFLGLHGIGMNFDLTKEGYEFDYMLPCAQRPGDYQPDPKNPLIIPMWKPRGAEPLLHRELESRVPYDGTTATFNLTTDQKSTNGNLKITLLRSPLKIRRGIDKYAWNVKVEMIDGGLLTENSPYPYWAPESGYQPAFVTGMTSNNVAWNRELKQNFYIKDGQGKYGRLLIDLFTDAVRPDTGIKIQTWLNPSGSQNLEFDSRKQITR